MRRTLAAFHALRAQIELASGTSDYAKWLNRKPVDSEVLERMNRLAALKTKCVMPGCKGHGIYLTRYCDRPAYLCSEHRLEKNLDKRFPVLQE